MIEHNALGVQAERVIADRVGLGLPELLIGQIHLLALDRPAEVPQVDANLIRAAGERPGFEQGGAVTQSSLHVKLGTGGQSRLLINGS